MAKVGRPRKKFKRTKRAYGYARKKTGRFINKADKKTEKYMIGRYNKFGGNYERKKYNTYQRKQYRKRQTMFWKIFK